jgi:pSer/pThr/pTyr-binding forkhead associated (FHA) protein
MAKLILSMDGLVLKEVVLTKERTTIGRKPHNDLVIDNLAVSGEHAVIVTILNDSFLEDLGSTNGTFVNGQPVKKHFLQNGDVVELGKYKIRFVADAVEVNNELDRTLVRNAAAPVAVAATDTAAAATQDLGQTSSMLSLSPALTTNPNMQRSPIVAPSEPQQQAVVRILNGANTGRELILTKALTTLGRPGVQVAVITRRPQGYYITHVEGAEYPVVNGRTLGAEAQLLTDKDVIVLSGTQMEFELRAPTSASGFGAPA